MPCLDPISHPDTDHNFHSNNYPYGHLVFVYSYLYSHIHTPNVRDTNTHRYSNTNVAYNHSHTDLHTNTYPHSHINTRSVSHLDANPHTRTVEETLMTTPNPKKKPRRFNPREIFAIVGIFFVFVGTVCAGTAYTIYHDVGAAGGSPFDPFFPNPTEQTTNQTASSKDPSELELGSDVEAIPPPQWDGATRVTMLVLGLDYRDWEAGQGPSRTDTMILLTIDPLSKTAGMLSIPRDLWANIPGFSPQKINAAFYFGELYRYPGGGPALAIKTVEQLIGVPIDYYAQIDFGAFVRFIDLIGGVTLEVTEPIELEVIDKQVDIQLDPGRYTFGGDSALAYARTRHDGDFNRAARQQQVVMGIRDQLLNPEIFSILIENASEIYAELTAGIDTNLPLEDAIKLAFLAIQIQEGDISKAVIGPSSFVYGTSPDGLSILIPLPDKIREIRDQIFASGGPFTPIMTGESLALMQLEGARISIKDGTGSDLANRTADYLRGLGANVVSISQADGFYDLTTITYYTGKPYTLAYLVSMMKVSQYKIFHRFNLNNPVDIEIILGSDWYYNNPMP